MAAPRSSKSPATPDSNGVVPSYWRVEIFGVLVQGAVFFAALALSLVVGIFLSTLFDGPGGLLITTILSGAGLLVGAGLSQTLRDHLLMRALDKR